MRSRIAVSLVLIGALAVAAPRSGGAQSGSLRVGLPSLPPTLDPATSVEGPVAFIARQAFDTLVQYRDGSSDVDAGLATHWAISRDGLSWSFRLRDGVRFHDGTPLQARHVAQSIERQLFPNPMLPTPNAVAPRLLRGTPGVVKSIRAVDTRTVQINLVVPYAPLLTLLAHPGFSVVLPRPAEGGATRWIGTGPFSVAEVAAGRIVLEANRSYWGGPPRVERVVMSEQPDQARAEAELDAGALDVLLPAGAPLRSNGASSIPGWRVGYLAMQTEKEPFSRKKVRQAIGAALDPALVSEALQETAVPLQSFLPTGVWGRREGSPVLGGNPEGARRLLAEAALSSRVLGARLLVPGGPAPSLPNRVADAIRAALAQADIRVILRVEMPEAARELAQRGEHELALLESQVDGGDPHLLLYPLSTSEGASKGPSALNLSFYRNRQLDDLLVRGSQLSFRPERQRVYGRAQAILADELPWIPLYVRLHWGLLRPEVRDFRLHPSGYHRLDRVALDGPVALGLPTR